MSVEAHIETTNGPEWTLANMKVANKAALMEAVEYWHEKIMPGHFTVEGGKRYNYQPRRGDDEPPYIERMTRWSVESKFQKMIRVKNPAYSWRKRRQKGHNKPLVWSGESEASAKKMIRLSSKVRHGHMIEATGAMTLPKYFYMYKQEYTSALSFPSGTSRTGPTKSQPIKYEELTRTIPAEVKVLLEVFNKGIAKRLAEMPVKKSKRKVA